jgi:hypothetical protein
MREKKYRGKVLRTFLFGMGTYRFGKIGTTVHDSKAQRNDLRGEEEADHVLLVRLHKWKEKENKYK